MIWEAAASAFSLYRALRAVNPSPYMFYLALGSQAVAGASPEVMARVEDGFLVSTSPATGAEAGRVTGFLGQVILEQARSPALRGGGDVVITGAMTLQRFWTMPAAQRALFVVADGRIAIAALALTTDTSALTAAGNDLGFEQAGAGQSEHRPHTLAAARNQVAGELGDQRNLALHAFKNNGVDAIHIGGDERHYRIERGLALVVQRMNGSGHGAALAGQRRFS